MVLVTANKPRRIVFFTFGGNVTVDQIVESSKDVAAILSDIGAGFRVLADLSSLDSMAVECAPEIAKTMDQCARKGVELIVRVIPDPAKDIGFSILTRFHYPNKPRTVVCQTVAEAGKLLELG